MARLSPLNTRQSNTTDNVKAKIDNVRQRFRTGRSKGPGQDPHWQDVQSSASWLHLQPVPHYRDPHLSLRLAREVSASHVKSGSDWRMGPDAQRKPTARALPPTRVEERFRLPCKYNSWRPCKQLTRQEP
jgi:hypothetical protein